MAITMTFDGAVGDYTQHTTFTEDGFTLTATSGMTQWAEDSSNDNIDGPNLASWYTPQTITLQNDSGTPFTINSIDLAEIYDDPNSGVPEITFTGYKSDGSTVVVQATLDRVDGVQTFTFPPDFTNLTKLEMANGYEASGWYQFDNIVLNDSVNVINGTPDDDALIGTPGADQINGFDGNDIERARGGDDELNGGNGHDFLIGGDGNDTLNGGDGDDYLRGGEGNDIVDGGAGYDRAAFTVLVNDPSIGETGVQTGATVDLNIQGVAQDTGHGLDTLIGIEHVSGTAYDDVLIGNAGDNWIWGEGGNDNLEGGDGNDLLETGLGNSALDGGTGTDTAAFVGNDDFISGVNVSLGLQGSAQTVAPGSDITLTNIENLSGSLHDDTLAGDSGANVVAGNTGNDSLAGGDGDDTLYGDGSIQVDTHGLGYSGPITTAADVASVDPSAVDGNDLLEGGAGNDQLDGGGGVDTASYEHNSGAVEVNLKFGFADEYTADGLTYLSSDILTNIEDAIGSAYDDVLSGSDGVNTLLGLGGNDNVIGNGGDDTINGGDGNDTLRGDQGNNLGVAGDDTLYGDNGNDFLNGGFGNDYLDGGNGYDRATYFTGATTGVHVDLNLQGVAQDTGSQGLDTLVNIENVSGTNYADTLIGDSGDNWLWGSGSYLPNGTPSGANNDTIDGGAGNDLLSVGAGDHSLTGGSGIDTVAYTENGSPEVGIAVSLDLQGAAQATGAGSWTLNGIENLSGGLNDDSLTGDGNDNVLAGDTGNDNLSGGAGSDTLYGDGRIGIDYAGGPGSSGPIATFADVNGLDPTLVDGDDVLEGGEGSDQLYGGGGSDTASYEHNGGRVDVLLTASGGFGDEYDAALNYLDTDVLHSIENVTGSAFDDGLSGNANDNVLAGGDGHDGLRGNDGDDTLLGGNGDDFLNGGLGDDVLDGGAGYDRAAYYTGATAGVTVDLNLQGVAQNTGQGIDTLINIENLSGTAFNDVLTGDGNDNVLWGSPATLTDGSISPDNNDTLDGRDGNDLLIAGIGNHSLTGGSGTDTVGFSENGAAEPALTISLELQGVAQATGAGSWTLNGIENLSGGLSDDSLTGDGGDNVLAGSSGDDSLVGGAGNDTLYGDGQINWDTHGAGGSGPIATFADVASIGGADGNDTLEGGLGDDVLNGGGGSDTASYAHASGWVEVVLDPFGGFADGADGNDTLIGIENVVGSAFNDNLLGDDGDNVIEGGDGHDLIYGFGGNDTLRGEGGDDFLRGYQGDDILDGGDGIDRASFYVGNSPSNGVHVDLNIQGVAQDTGYGMDTLIGIENLSGTVLDDVLIGDDGDNWLQGGADNVLGGGSGNDTISGNGGNDLIEVGAGNHSLSGGSGSDTLSFFGNATEISAAGATFSLVLQGAAQGTEQGMMNASGFENLSGSIFDDNLTGDSSNNVIAGDVGNDSLAGGAGDDTLYGDGRTAPDTHGVGGSGPITTYTDAVSLDPSLVDGNDTLEGGAGNDLINGGGGSDTASYEHNGGPVDVNLQFGFADEYASDGATYLSTDTLVSIENATGSAFDDSLNGNGAANVLSGLSGTDFIQGQGGNDTIYGGDGDDTLRGDAGENSLAVSGDDIVYGENGNDNLRGGLGNDQLYGGANNDLLRGNGGVDYFDGGADDGEGFNGIGDRVSFFEARATQGAVADLRTGVISNDGFGNVETMVNIESLGADTAFVDTFYGNDSRNFIGGGRGDNLYGFGGDDLFQTGAAAAIIDGGTGVDTLQLDTTGGWFTPDADGDGIAESAAAATSGWLVDLGGGSMVDGYGNFGTITAIENVNGSILSDSLIGSGVANVLNGGDGDDFLRGAGGNDTLVGGAGQDFLNGGAGNDVIDGGDGIDRVAYSSGATAGVTVSLAITTAQNTGSQGFDTITNVENLSGTRFNDTLTGNGGDNWIWGGSDGSGITGNDNINAGAGNDLVEVGTGNHTLNGGLGVDTLSLFGNATDITSTGVAFDLSAQGSAQNTRQGMMNASGFENVSGSIYGDSLTGDTGNNVLLGDVGNDTLRGGDGNDTLYGDGRTLVNGTGSGAITTWGDITTIDATLTPGNDQLLGGRGDDFLYGGRGNDTLTGNQGNDHYVIETSSGADHVTDFAAGSDKVLFSGIAGVDDFSDLTLTKVGSNTVITWGTSDSLTMDGVKPNQLHASDFEFSAGASAFAAAAQNLVVSNDPVPTTPSGLHSHDGDSLAFGVSHDWLYS